LEIKETNGLGEHDEVPEKLIPSAFSEDNAVLGQDNLAILRRHYIKCYLQLRRELLDFLEDWVYT
jgi:hypothetical protein